MDSDGSSWNARHGLPLEAGLIASDTLGARCCETKSVTSTYSREKSPDELMEDAQTFPELDTANGAAHHILDIE